MKTEEVKSKLNTQRPKTAKAQSASNKIDFNVTSKPKARLFSGVKVI
jgi:hypothetical protein